MNDKILYCYAFSNLVNQENLSVYIKDSKLRYVYCSDLYVKTLGVSPASFLYGKTDLEVFSGLQFEANHKEDTEVLQTGKLISHNSPHVGGLPFKTNLVKKAPIYSDTKEIIGVLNVIQTIEITTNWNTQIEKELVEEIGNFGTWRLYLKDYQIEISKGLYRILGYSNFSILSLENLFNFSHSDYSEVYKQTILNSIENQKDAVVERKIINLQGEERYLLEKIYFQNIGNQLSLFSVVLDSTKIHNYENIIFEQKKQLEETLKEKTEELFGIIQHKNRLLNKYEAFLDSLGEISYERNLKTQTIVWNGDVDKILKYTKEEMPKTWKDYLSIIHPDDIENLNSKFTKLTENPESYSLEYRILDKSNEYRWVLDKGLCIKEKEDTVEFLGILRDIQDVKTSAMKIQELAFKDELTGLYNRRGVFQLLETNFYQAQRYGLYMELYYCDLNDFKRINDELGHDIGDAALVDFANILKKTLRKSDILGRVGGDEFIFFSINTEPNQNSNLEARLKKAVDEFNKNLSRPYQLSFSIGRVEYDSILHATPDDLIAEADFTMYQNKRMFKGNK